MVAVVHSVKPAAVIIGDFPRFDISAPEIQDPVKQDQPQSFGLCRVAGLQDL